MNTLKTQLDTHSGRPTVVDTAETGLKSLEKRKLLGSIKLHNVMEKVVNQISTNPTLAQFGLVQRLQSFLGESNTKPQPQQTKASTENKIQPQSIADPVAKTESSNTSPDVTKLEQTLNTSPTPEQIQDRFNTLVKRLEIFEEKQRELLSFDKQKGNFGSLSGSDVTPQGIQNIDKIVTTLKSEIQDDPEMSSLWSVKFGLNGSGDDLVGKVNSNKASETLDLGADELTMNNSEPESYSVVLESILNRNTLDKNKLEGDIINSDDESEKTFLKAKLSILNEHITQIHDLIKLSDYVEYFHNDYSPIATRINTQLTALLKSSPLQQLIKTREIKFLKKSLSNLSFNLEKIREDLSVSSVDEAKKILSQGYRDKPIVTQRINLDSLEQKWSKNIKRTRELSNKSEKWIDKRLSFAENEKELFSMDVNNKIKSIQEIDEWFDKNEVSDQTKQNALKARYGQVQKQKDISTAD